MAYATQITIVHGRKGSRSARSFVLGAESRAHREQVREILGLQELEKIEREGFEGAFELDGTKLSLALKRQSAEIDAIGDEGLRRPFQQMRQHWLSLGDRDDAFALAELV